MTPHTCQSGPPICLSPPSSTRGTFGLDRLAKHAQCLSASAHFLLLLSGSRTLSQRPSAVCLFSLCRSWITRFLNLRIYSFHKAYFAQLWPLSVLSGSSIGGQPPTGDFWCWFRGQLPRSDGQSEASSARSKICLFSGWPCSSWSPAQRFASYSLQSSGLDQV